MANTVSIEDLADAILAELEEYKQDTTEQLKSEIRKVAIETAAEISAISPRKTGKYAKGWKAAKLYESNDDIRFRIANKNKYQLTHLLEDGYVRRNGTRVPGRPHIAPAEKLAEEKLGKKVKVICGG